MRLQVVFDILCVLNICKTSTPYIYIKEMVSHAFVNKEREPIEFCETSNNGKLSSTHNLIYENFLPVVSVASLRVKAKFLHSSVLSTP